MLRPKRDIAHIHLYNHGFIKSIPIWGYGYSDLQCACSLRFKYRIISLILYKEWEETNFGEGFEISAKAWDGHEVVRSYNLDLELMRMHYDYVYTQNRGITKKQERVFVCLDLARIIAAYVYLRAKRLRYIEERCHESISEPKHDPFAAFVSQN